MQPEKLPEHPDMKKLTKLLAVISILILVASATVYLLSQTYNPKPSIKLNPHYLEYQGNKTKIWLSETNTRYGTANETYFTSNGYLVQKGAPLFIIAVTLRNDYTSDNPPPSIPGETQTSPADGTAYVYLNAQLNGQRGPINASDVSVSDFTIPMTAGSGYVFASGQTSTINLDMATARNDIDNVIVNLVFLGDSIPL